MIYMYNLFSKDQHEFVTRRSCSTQLLELTEVLTVTLDYNGVVNIIYPDFLKKKAFDEVPRKRLLKVRKTARIRNRYNQVPHLSQDAKLESTKITINISNKSQEVSPFPLDNHKAAMNRHESMANKRHK